jgi:hypothetical protein
MGQPLKIVRRVFDSEEAQCGPSERAELVPHLMLPEGSGGITELHARILVSAHAEHKSEWLACAPFAWIYQGLPQDLPERTPRSTYMGWWRRLHFNATSTPGRRRQIRLGSSISWITRT